MHSYPHLGISHLCYQTERFLKLQSSLDISSCSNSLSYSFSLRLFIMHSTKQTSTTGLKPGKLIHFEELASLLHWVAWTAASHGFLVKLLSKLGFSWAGCIAWTWAINSIASKYVPLSWIKARALSLSSSPSSKAPYLKISVSLLYISNACRKVQTTVRWPLTPLSCDLRVLAFSGHCAVHPLWLIAAAVSSSLWASPIGEVQVNMRAAWFWQCISKSLMSSRSSFQYWRY